jgi:hypothetical protein
MLQLIVILTVGFILTPLIDLASSERAIFFIKLIVYALALAWIVYVTFIHPVRL